MIPVKLKLSNFTSYGENPPELDFTKFKLAAISGQNGAGKSSLLDAITWCVWGDSRAGESSDALVRLGANEMYVEFSFELDSHIYTVKRLRNKKSGGHSMLELWSNSHNLTEGTIKATQQKIIDSLHLTYETFTNSSFIRQGNAGEFTTKGPTDRKRILADILGLDHYDKLEEKAKEKAKEAQTKLTLLDYQVLEIEAELSTKEEKQKELEQAEKEAKNLQEELKESEHFIKTIEDEKQIVVSSIQSLKEKVAQINEIKKEIEEIKLQIDLKLKAKQDYQTLLDQKDIIEEKNKKLLRLQEEKKDLEIKRSELIKVKDELAVIQRKIIELENRRQIAITTLEVEIKKYQTQNDSLQKEIEQLKARKDICPTCKQPIGLEVNKQIIAKNQKQIEENDQKLQMLNDKLKKCQTFELKEQAQADEKEKEVKDLEQQTKDYQEINKQIMLLEKYADLNTKLQQAETAVKAQQEAIDDLEKIARSKETQINNVTKHLDELEIFENKLQEIESKLSAKQTIKEELTQKVMEAKAKVGAASQLKTRFEQLEDLFKKKLDEKKKLNEDKSIYEELALAFGKKGIQAMIIEQAIPEIEDEANRLLEKLTEGRMKVNFLTQKETKTKVASIDGKKDYAIVETLDIIISDEMGERSYEMYSGGETFRVNFAIRLAISKLLAHRAGAKLQFLVVDEGFGTQDAPGRARLVEVIDTIKTDFEKILIITHLEELKEEFPTRIEVTKDSAGSSFEVVGN
ncbi:SMC family ATPase [Candidatus Daviesbacteria bacterium]|nr:SMC family ATPase [Candidatus Daviesbacteria bacterium]